MPQINQTQRTSEIRLIHRLLDVEDRRHVGRRLLAMLICHMDESGGQETFTLACAMSDDRKWIKLDRHWQKALDEFGIPFFHMKNLIARKPPYAGWSQYKVDALIRKMVYLFQMYVMGWCSTTVVIRDFYEVIKTDRKRKLRNPYYHAFSTCLSGAFVFAQDKPSADSVSFVLDRGGASKARLAYDFASFGEIDGLPKEKLGVLLFGNDEKNNGLQAADLLAYEVHKHHQGFKRGSYEALCRLSHVDYLCDAKTLKDMFKKLPEVLV